jgi:PTH1 family peptidyl-tRNA hydrolase
MENLYLIVGLGNPGKKYARTRHNAGFLVLEQLADNWRAAWSDEKKFHARLARVETEGWRALLCQPRTFMNASGEAVAAVGQFYRVPASRTLIVVDDADLPFGEIRLRASGSSGGHHGLESVEQHLATRAYPRLRIGIGRTENAVREITGHVLSQFTADEARLLENVLQRASDQIECWLGEGIVKAMNQFNGTVPV